MDLGSFAYRQRVLAEDGCLRIPVASTFTERKAIPYGLEAVALLARAGRAVRLTVIGDPQGGEAQERQNRPFPRR